MVQNFDWDGGSGDWSEPAGWVGGTVASGTLANVTIAGASSDVSIAGGESYTVDLITLGSGATLNVEGYTPRSQRFLRPWLRWERPRSALFAASEKRRSALQSRRTEECSDKG